MALIDFGTQTTEATPNGCTQLIRHAKTHLESIQIIYSHSSEKRQNYLYYKHATLLKIASYFFFPVGDRAPTISREIFLTNKFWKDFKTSAKALKNFKYDFKMVLNLFCAISR